MRRRRVSNQSPSPDSSQRKPLMMMVEDDDVDDCRDQHVVVASASLPTDGEEKPKTRTTTATTTMMKGHDEDPYGYAKPRNLAAVESSSNYKHHSYTYYPAKWAILRLLAIVYLTAFLGAWHQNEGLMGRHGLMPAEEYWKNIQSQFMDDATGDVLRWKGFLKYPTLFWWIPLSDFTMRWFIVAPGIFLSSMVLALGVNSWLLQLLLWILYFSIVTLANGTTFYAYGWESQLLETGFLSIFLCHLPVHDSSCSTNKSFRVNLWESKPKRAHDDDDEDKEEPPSDICLWLFRWLIFRISLGAGLIKIRGASCWTTKTCLHYHFQSQPLPSPLSFAFHFLPKTIQTHMVDIDLWVQLYTSWIVLLPTRPSPWSLGGQNPASSSVTTRPPSAWWTQTVSALLLLCQWLVRLGGFVQAGFMVGIIFSGNFSFLNHLTIIPALACLDDGCWPSFLRRRHSGPRSSTSVASNSDRRHHHPSRPQQRWILLDWTLLGCILYLSWPVIANLLQLEGRGRQVMNASFGSFRLVNTYGAFGDVGRFRFEPIISIRGERNDTVKATESEWIELEFPCKPGFKPHKRYLQQREQWLYALLKKLLETPGSNDEQPWLDLLDRSTADYLTSVYYSKGKAPRYAKVDMYHYRMAAPLWEIVPELFRNGRAQWWMRTFEEDLIPVVEVTHHQLQLAQIDED